MPYGRERPTYRRLVVPNPAVAADWSLRNDSGGNWLVRSLTYTLTTDANVANRVPTLTITAAEDLYVAISSASVIAAATQTRFMHLAGLTEWGTTAFTRGMPWPAGGQIIQPGHIMATVTTNKQAGDQYSAIIADLIEFPETYPLNFLPFVPMFQDSEGN